MFGSVAGWFYHWLGGIQPLPEYPGFRKFLIAPALPADLGFVNCTYRSPFGLIKSNWKKSNGGNTFEISVPKASSAIFRIQVKNNTTVVIDDLDNKKVVSKKAKTTLFEHELSEGNYRISYN